MRLTSSFLALLLLLSFPTASAQDTWSEPFPGVQRLHHQRALQNINVLAVDLCHPGISVRATAPDERQKTPSEFGKLVEAQAVVNGDFFKYEDYSTIGLSAHAGNAWPETEDDDVSGPVGFGKGRIKIVSPERVEDPEPWMREIVSGHPILLREGEILSNDSQLCTNRHPRTVLGLNEDGTKLFLAVVDGRAVSRLGMRCNDLAELMLELGAHEAINLDGGGSSAMWLEGDGVVSVPSGGEQRVVANHLAIYARGEGDATHCPVITD